MIDRYTQAVLTLIATALVYLCVVVTPWPGVQAQTAARPGESTGPAQVVIVGWRGQAGESIPVTTLGNIGVTVSGPVQVNGRVTTEKASDRADRVVLVGWEEGATRERAANRLQSFTNSSSLPVDVK